jgi:hypothetical protein
MLKAYCLKHERSKGYLIEKMIRKFCGEVEAAPATQVVVVEKPKVKRFVPPLVHDVDLYMVEKGVSGTSEAHRFYDFYESNGWKVGKNKMKCWKAAVRNWLKGNNNGHQKASTKLSAHERVKQRNNAKYRSNIDECGLGMGADDGHMGRTVDEGKGRTTIEHVDNSAFIDYE